MLSLILATLGTASGQDADQAMAAFYDCTQTNPMEFTNFHLRFRANITADPDRPMAATLWDLESDNLRIASRDLDRSRAFWIEGYEAYVMGRDDVDTGYVLRVPAHGDLSGEFRAQVVQVFGDGRAQWVNEFVCTEL